MTLEIGMLVRRQVMLDEVCEKPDEIVAAAFLRHGQSHQRTFEGPECSTLARSNSTSNQLRSRIQSRR